MLGADGTRSYLVVFQNSAEWRSLGGVVGAVAQIDADDGRLALGAQASSTDFQDAGGEPVADLRVWDPYHCAGGVKSRLGALGFTHVVNDPELDFYDVVDGAAPPPPHDVLVTNPPFWLDQ